MKEELKNFKFYNIINDRFTKEKKQEMKYYHFETISSMKEKILNFITLSMIDFV